MKPSLGTLIRAALVAWPCILPAAEQERDVTFISASDPHYREPDHKHGNHNDLNRASVEEINRIAGMEWPEKAGGGVIEKPRGVLLLGDVIDDGDMARGGRNLSAEQYGFFLKDFGFDGTDGLLKYPVYEGWGNHDGPPIGKEKNGFSFQARLKERNELRKQKGMVANLCPKGLHYSWDWGGVHFVQLNIYPADKQNPAVRYSPVWHDPQGSLTFLKEDLAKNVGTSGRPVVLTAHCGFDTDWWIKEDWAALHAAAKSYNVVLYIYGHTGTGVREWAPEGESKKWTCINDGHADAGFFVIQIKGDRLRAAYRMKEGLKFSKGPDGKNQHEWNGGWGWSWFVDKKI